MQSFQNPATPILRPESAHLFLHPDDVEPWAIPDTDLATSALKFGTRFCLLSLSHNEDMLVMGKADVTDCLDPALSLDKIFYRTPYGNVVSLDVNNMVGDHFTMANSGNYRDWVIDFTTTVNKFGPPKSWFSKAIDKVYKLCGRELYANIHVSGIINLQMGTVEINAVGFDGVTPVGYTLNANRHNPNRRPGKCPYMHGEVA